MGEAGFVPMTSGGETSRPGLAPGLAGLHLTPEEFDAIDYEDCEPGYRYELIQGVVIVNPAAGIPHNSPNQYLGHLLINYKELHPQGHHLDDSEHEVYIAVPNGRRLADRVLWIGLGRQPLPQHDVPTIAVEFVSKPRRDWLRDYVEKRDEYISVGIKEYWVIDRFRRKLTVFRPIGSSEVESVVPETGIYTTPLLPGFELPVAKLIGLSDRWTSAESK